MKKMYEYSEIGEPMIVKNMNTYKAIQLAWDFADFYDATGLRCEEQEDGTVKVIYEYFDGRDVYKLQQIIEEAINRGL